MFVQVMRREFLVLTQSKGHRVAIIVMGLLIILAGVVARIAIPMLQDSLAPSTPEMHAAVEEGMAPLSPALEGIAGPAETIATGSGESWVQEQVAQGADDDSEAQYFALGGSPEAPIVYTSLAGTELLTSGLQQTVGQSLMLAGVNSLVPEGLSPQQQGAVLALANPQIVSVETSTGGSSVSAITANPMGYFTGIVACSLLLMAVAIGMGTISQGVVEEKSSRVVEILVSTVRPRQLLLGKILGIGLFVVAELIIWMICAIIAVKISGIDLTINLSGTVFWVLAWVIVGFFIFATLVGGIAATVSRQEDLGAVQTPVVFGMLIPFYLALYLVPFMSDATITKVLSWIPGFSSFMMPMRYGLDKVETWELWAALALAIVTVPLFTRIAGRIYQNSILKMGKRVTLKEALHLSRA